MTVQPQQEPASNGKKLPPMVPGSFFFGNVLQMKKRPVDFLVDAAAQYGSVFRLKAPGVRATVITGPEGRDLIDQENENGLTRKGLFDAFATEAGVDIFGVQGELHEQLRTLVRLGYCRQVPAQFIGKIARTVREEVNKWKAGQQMRLFETMSDLTLFCAMDIVSPVSLRHLADDITRFGNDVMMVVTRGRPNAILWMPAYRRARNTVYRELEEIINRHRGGEFDADPNLYMIDAFMQARAKDGEGMSDRDVRGGCAYGLCGTQIYLGRLTGFIMFELLRDKSLLEKVRREVDAAYSTSEEINPKLFRRMPYLRSVYHEALRSYPLLPGLPFVAEREIEVNGFTIPKNDLVLISPVPSHFSSENYSNPCTFQATRCMAPRNEHQRHGAFAPFGLGKRTCLASGMSEIISLTAVSVLVREMELKLERPTYRMEVSPIPLIAPPDGVPIVVVGKRKPPTEISLTVLTEASDLASAVEEERGEQKLPEVDPVRFEAGQVIIEQGTQADYFYILLDGQVSVIKTDDTTNESEVVAQLGPGQSFGELGLLKNVPRQATVRTDTDVRVMRIDRSTFMQLAMDSDLLGDELGALLQQRFLQRMLAEAMPSLNQKMIEQYAAGFGLRSYQAGDMIIRQGDPAEEFYIVVAGSVAVLREGPHGSDRLAVLNPGDYFGEIGILNRQPRNATVSAEGAVEVMYLGREQFLEIANESSETREDIALTICRRIFNNIVEDE